MKKPIALFLAILFAASLAGCAVRPSHEDPVESGSSYQEQHGEGSSEPSPNAEETPSHSETDPVLFESSGFTLSLPGDYTESVIVNPEYSNEESPEYTLFDVYYRPSYDAAKAEGYMGGKLFSIWQLNRAQYEQYLSEGDWINEYAFACDGSHYYIMEEPADIQIGSPEEWEPYCETLEACCPAAMETFIPLNELEPYSDDTFWNSAETYGGEHRYFRYYPYRAYPEAETTENKEMYYTIMLSQPVKQGNSGIWCVERVYDAEEYGYIYAVFPREAERPAMEVYTEQQASADGGNHGELLDPLSVALEFVKARYGHGKATADSFEEASGPPEGHYTF